MKISDTIHSENITIKEMSLTDLETALTWAKEEKWNPGKFDYHSYYAMGKENFLGLHINGEMIGSISIIQYKKSFAFIGLFIVKKEYRGQGYGKKLWDYSIKNIENTSSISLYSVPQQISRYQKNNFFDNVKNSRFQMNKSVEFDISRSDEIKEIDNFYYNKMIEYDQNLWKSSRNDFFNCALKKPETFAFISFDENKKVNGYGLIRPCIEGYRIGPLYANSIESAKSLTKFLLSKIPKESQVIFDIPNENKLSIIFADYFKLDHYSEADTMLMTKGESYKKGDEYCYGLASLEIG